MNERPERTQIVDLVSVWRDALFGDGFHKSVTIFASSLFCFNCSLCLVQPSSPEQSDSEPDIRDGEEEEEPEQQTAYQKLLSTLGEPTANRQNQEDESSDEEEEEELLFESDGCFFVLFFIHIFYNCWQLTKLEFQIFRRGQQ